jgi:NAD(P)-dependent dehydrogenase (short-subunit alcohol dehydrogenase family)
MMELELKGKSVLITGASKGIGQAAAEVFAGEGAVLHLVSRTEADLLLAKKEIEDRHGVPVTVHAMDLSQSERCTELAGLCRDVDILVNNAGAIPPGDLLEIDEVRWRDAWDLKVFGYINLTRFFLRAMSNRGNGVILNVLGLAGENFTADYVAGSTGNAGLMAFTRTVGSRSLEKGVRVLGVNPGLVETDRMVTILSKRALDEKGDAARWQDYLADMPLGRGASAKECGDLIAFLCSARASYMSGVIVTLDGGLAARN